MAYMMSMGEANRRITEYLNKFSDAVSYQDGNTLQRLLSFSSESPSLLSLADALNLTQVSSILFILLHPPPQPPNSKFRNYSQILESGFWLFDLKSS